MTDTFQSFKPFTPLSANLSIKKLPRQHINIDIEKTCRPILAKQSFQHVPAELVWGQSQLITLRLFAQTRSFHWPTSLRLSQTECARSPLLENVDYDFESNDLRNILNWCRFKLYHKMCYEPMSSLCHCRHNWGTFGTLYFLNRHSDLSFLFLETDNRHQYIGNIITHICI